MGAPAQQVGIEYSHRNTLGTREDRGRHIERSHQAKHHIGANVDGAGRLSVGINSDGADTISGAKHDLAGNTRLPPRDRHGEAGRSKNQSDTSRYKRARTGPHEAKVSAARRGWKEARMRQIAQPPPSLKRQNPTLSSGVQILQRRGISALKCNQAAASCAFAIAFLIFNAVVESSMSFAFARYASRPPR